MNYSLKDNCGSRYELCLQAFSSGPDWTFIMTGGSAPHVGALALSWPDAPDPEIIGLTATVSSLSAPGHRDDEVARACAKRAAARLQCRVAVSCGIHIHHATIEELGLLKEASRRLCDAMCDQILSEKS